jgi:hypothetical protein
MYATQYYSVGHSIAVHMCGIQYRDSSARNEESSDNSIQ